MLNKPLIIDCDDYKIIRTNTLLTNDQRELHARLVQNDCSYDASKPKSIVRNNYLVWYYDNYDNYYN